MSLVDAWEIWIAGMPVTGMLYSMPIVWWGRVGKLLEFFAALTIVADIAGPVRLRDWGKSLYRVLPGRVSISLGSATFEWSRLIWKAWRSEDEERKQLIDRALDTRIGMANVVLAVFIAGRVTYIIAHDWVWYSIIIAFTVCFIGVAMSVAPIIIAMVLFTVTVAGVITDVLFIRPAAWLLDHDAADKWVKLVAAIALVVGFHFDLLAS